MWGNAPTLYFVGAFASTAPPIPVPMQCCGKHGHPTTVCRFCQSTCYSCGECGHMQMMCKRGKKLTSDKPQVNQISLKDDDEDVTIYILS